MRKFCFTLATMASVLLCVGANISAAQGASGERIEKISNRRLAGHTFLTLRGLDYQQCEARCLSEQQCKALEHVHGSSSGLRASTCRLFSSFTSAHASTGADVGYKLPGLAKGAKPQPEKSPPKVTAAPPPAPGAEPRARSVAPSPPPPPPVGAGGGQTSKREEGAQAPAEGRKQQESESTSRSITRSSPPPAAPPTAMPPGGSNNPAVAPQVPPSSDWDVVPVFYGTDRSATISPSASATARTEGTASRLGGRS